MNNWARGGRVLVAFNFIGAILGALSSLTFAAASEHGIFFFVVAVIYTLIAKMLYELLKYTGK